MPDLAQLAIAARENAHAPYSKFRVGAALETSTGEIYTGCNVENATYGLTLCAERLAIFKAISEGVRPGSFTHIVIAADTPALTPPCGACRQILSEFAPAATITLVNLAGLSKSYSIAELLPESFNDSFFR